MIVDRYTIYGDPERRESVALAAALVAKGIEFELVPETASLSLILATRAGSETGPYLRTPEGFVLADLHAILEWVERCHPSPRLVPATPVRRTCARILEDWIEFWLPLWPRRSWSTLIGLGAHLEAAGFLLGGVPCRSDLLLAAWLETEVLVHEHARQILNRDAPRLGSFGETLLESAPSMTGARSASTMGEETSDDAVPISLLPVLGEVAADYHAYLVGNQRALKDRRESVLLDLGLGKRAFPVRKRCEARRAAIGRELAALEPDSRRDVRRVLEPVGAWYALTLPDVTEEADPSDPRSL